MKLKIKKLNRIIEDLSSREMDLILHLVQRQDSLGVVPHMTYEDMIEDTKMPRSTFYGAMKQLEGKGIVHVTHSNKDKGFKVFVTENSFLKKMDDFKQGYVNINYDFISGEDFTSLNVNVKKFFMRLLGLKAHLQSVKLLKDTLKKYNVLNKMDKLKELFDIEAVEGGFLFRIKDSILKNKPSDNTNQSHLSYKQKVVAYCRSYKISYTKQELIDTYKTVTNHMNKGRFNMVAKAFDKIIQTRKLQPKLISYLGGKAYN